MWTKDNRARYDRSALRYPSDLTDAEWAEVAPLIPRSKRGGNKRTVNVREVVNGICISSARAVSGGRSRKICRHAARCMIILRNGTGTARWRASITHSK